MNTAKMKIHCKLGVCHLQSYKCMQYLGYISTKCAHTRRAPWQPCCHVFLYWVGIILGVSVQTYTSLVKWLAHSPFMGIPCAHVGFGDVKMTGCKFDL